MRPWWMYAAAVIGVSVLWGLTCSVFGIPPLYATLGGAALGAATVTAVTASAP